MRCVSLCKFKHRGIVYCSWLMHLSIILWKLITLEPFPTKISRERFYSDKYFCETPDVKFLTFYCLVRIINIITVNRRVCFFGSCLTVCSRPYSLLAFAWRLCKNPLPVQYPDALCFRVVRPSVRACVPDYLACHYFPPDPQLPPQPLRGLIPILLLGEQGHDGCEQFAWDCYPTASRLRFEPGPFCAWVQHTNHSATEPPHWRLCFSVNHIVIIEAKVGVHIATFQARLSQ